MSITNSEIVIGFSDEFSYDNNLIKYQITTDGRLGLYVEDCARALGVSQTKKRQTGTFTTVRWDRVFKDLQAIEVVSTSGDWKSLSKEVQKDIKCMVISETDLYKWSFRVETEQGKKFRDWLATTVLPCLKQHGIYVTGMENMSPAEIELAVKERTESYVLRKFGIGIRRELTDAIKDVINPGITDGWIYGKFTNIIYSVLFGMDAKEYKASRGMQEKDNIRDVLKENGEAELLNQITKAEDFMCNLLRAGITDYETMKKMITTWFSNYKTSEIVKC